MSEMNFKQLILGGLQTNCYIVYNEANEAVIIDPATSFARIKESITSLLLKPQAVLLTHGHFDHMMAADELRKEYNIDIYAHELEQEVLTLPAYNLSAPFMGEAYSLKADKFFKDGDELKLLGTEFKVIYTPGHTIGSSCFYLKDYKMLFSGDTLFYQSYGRYDFPTGSGRQLSESIKTKLMKLDDDVSVFPGHNNSTTIGDERYLWE